MAEEQKTQTAEHLTGIVMEEIQSGAGVPAVQARFAKLGIEEAKARELAQALYDQVVTQAREEQMTPTSLGFGIGGGFAAAVVAGIVWGWIAILTNYEIGYIAIGVGALAGYGVVFAAGYKKGFPLQVTAVACSLLGILIGKYVTFFHALKDLVEEQGGKAGELSIFSLEIMRIFIENLGAMLGGFDFLWVILAVMAAWKIPRGLGVDPSKIKA